MMIVSQEQEIQFMRILIKIGIEEKDVKAITLMVEKPEHMSKLLSVLRKNDFKMTSQEIYRAAAEIITGRSIDDLIYNSPEGIVHLEDWKK